MTHRLFIILLAAAALARAESPASYENNLTMIRDKDGGKVTAATAANAPLFEARKGNPVMAPDGHQVTLAEFRQARGSVTVKCVDRGTRANVHLYGLIPNGVYTIWVFAFRAPGGADNIKGVGALGEDKDGNGNVVRADEDGEGFISAFTPGGALTARGEIASCWQTDEFEISLDGVYHIDNRPWGRVPGPEGSWVEQFGFRFRQMSRVLLFTQDRAGKPVDADSPASTPLYEARAGQPILAPDGHQVTLGEFRMAQGSISVKCTARGTRTSIHLNGLIPDGIYTVWLLNFRPPGGLENLIGGGALGGDNGASANVFVADRDGEAYLTAVNPPGPLTMMGEIGACWPATAEELHVVGVYHIDGASHGPVPGPAGTAVEHFGFMFRK
ncbi:MAG: hypothetical protein HYR60_02740 [Acidobacteria bacterium]|nr:hypothetical protein [Acidobacteriota bacterium]